MAVSKRLIALCHHRWAIPIVAAVARQKGVRFVYLVNGLGIPRDTVTRTLKALMESDLIRRNPGYGHPLRPEYILTPKAQRTGQACIDLVSQATRLEIGEIIFRKWTLPVIATFSGGEAERRFSEIKSMLPGVSSRALAMTLKDLEDADLLKRRVIDDYPPSVVYRLTDSGRSVRRVVKSLPI